MWKYFSSEFPNCKRSMKRNYDEHSRFPCLCFTFTVEINQLLIIPDDWSPDNLFSFLLAVALRAIMLEWKTNKLVCCPRQVEPRFFSLVVAIMRSDKVFNLVEIIYCGKHTKPFQARNKLSIFFLSMIFFLTRCWKWCIMAICVFKNHST